MKTIFKDITARLETVTELRWIDEDKGQMNYERPPIVFPAALVTLSIPQSTDLNRTRQNCNLGVSVKLCFDFAGNTNNHTPEGAREESLAYYDIVDKVWKALQGFAGTDFNPLSRRNFGQVPRPDGYKTVVINFVSDFWEVVD